MFIIGSLVCGFVLIGGYFLLFLFQRKKPLTRRPVDATILAGKHVYGKVYRTYHPTIPYEVYLYKNGEDFTTINGSGCLNSIRVHSIAEAQQIVDAFNLWASKQSKGIPCP